MYKSAPNPLLPLYNPATGGEVALRGGSALTHRKLTSVKIIPILTIALTLTGCAAFDPPQDWPGPDPYTWEAYSSSPALPPSYSYVPQSTIDQSGYCAVGAIACADRRGGVCKVLLGPRANAYSVWHETKHCRGYAHIG